MFFILWAWVSNDCIMYTCTVSILSCKPDTIMWRYVMAVSKLMLKTVFFGVTLSIDSIFCRWSFWFAWFPTILHSYLIIESTLRKLNKKIWIEVFVQIIFNQSLGLNRSMTSSCKLVIVASLCICRFFHDTLVYCGSSWIDCLYCTSNLIVGLTGFCF